jgi:tRNA-splicing ligase RtcB
MAKKIRGKELRKMGYPQGRAIGMAIDLIHQHYKREDKKVVLGILQKVVKQPDDFREDPLWGRIAQELTGPVLKENEHALIEGKPEFEIYGEEGIEHSALDQMYTAMKLPVTVKGALMPDAHHGYGLPIGGVLATNNAVIPYGVGVDIGCRMCMTVYDLPVERLGDQRDKFVKLLGDNSRFGQAEFDRPFDDPIFERTEFKEIKVAKQLKNRAAKQIGTSGGGNHFVEFGVVDIRDRNNVLGLEIGRYVGVLSHSGSRGLGANIARHYTKMAMEACKLPKVAKHLAWLDLDSELGQEYWLAMNLAGDYASACHHHIHRRMADSLGLKPLTMVENHHNFAWKEQLADGTEVVVHRKGATPAQKGVLGIIPGSMTAPGFIVSGKGQPGALQSASHGAGRQMSRTVAKNSTTRNALNKLLQEEGVTLLGGGLDESPIAYKDIHQVMRSQTDLVDIVGLFYPKIVRMAD